MQVDKYRPETCCVIGNYYSLKGEHEKAVRHIHTYFRYTPTQPTPHLRCTPTPPPHPYLPLRRTPTPPTSAAPLASRLQVTYFRRALKLNQHFLSAWTLMGHEYVELKNTAAAVDAYRHAVDINAKDYRAWYGPGWEESPRLPHISAATRKSHQHLTAALQGRRGPPAQARR